MFSNNKIRVVLLANDLPGLEVARFLAQRGDDIVRLYLHDPSQQKLADEIVAASGVSQDRVFFASQIRDHVGDFQELQADFIVTVYWAHLLPRNIFGMARRATVNFHPAMLPINRGWHPHVHSLLDGSPTGVTLHAIDDAADTGPVWAQRAVPLQATDTAKDIYNRLQTEIIALFRESWPRIVAGEITPVPQDHRKAVYHKKSEIECLDRIDLDRPTTARQVINLLRARTFGNRGFAFYEENGKKVHVHLRLKVDSDFSKT